MMSFLASLFDGLSPELVWGLFPRLIGVLQCVAFASMVPQVLAVAGSRGIGPMPQRMARARRDYPGLRGVFMQPTLFWLGTSDALLLAVPIVGFFGASLAIVGGPLGFAGQLVAWVCLLSLDAVFNLGFPWDCMLLEASFLALFLPATPTLPVVSTTTLPLPLMSFMWRLFAVRVMWGFALTKFAGIRANDKLYLKWFFAWMPLTTPLGWWAYHAPRFVLVSSYFLMFVLEVVFPGLGLFSGPMRMLGGVGLIALMIGIELTGNWGYFNVGYALLCVCLFDTQSSVVDVFRAPLSDLWATPELAAMNGVLVFLLVLQLIYFPFNNWVTLLWPQWAWDDVTGKLPIFKPFFALLRAISPFRIVHGYGVFPPISMAPVRIVPVIEGSHDGVTWRKYPYRFLPVKAEDGPRWVAPHHPRIDQALVYVAGGFNDATLLSGLSGFGKPYTYAPHMVLECVMQRVLEGEPMVLKVFRENPFPEGPPRYVRATTYAFHPTTPEELKKTGLYYHCHEVGMHLPVTERDPSVFRYWLADPECFHPDMVHYRRAAPALSGMVRAFKAGTPFEQALCANSELTGDDVRAFFDELLPAISGSRGDWSRLGETVRAMNERFGVDRMRRFERILERAVFLLRTKLEPHVWGKATPHVEVKSNFQFHLLMQALVLDGRETVDATFRDPSRAASRLSELDHAQELFAIGLFRYPMITFQIRCLQLIDSMTDWPAFDVGALAYFPFLRTQFSKHPIWTPNCQRLPNGDWSVTNFVQEQAR